MYLNKNIVFVLLLSICNAIKVLVVFPIPAKSHGILGEKMVKHLIDAGLEVTYITPLPIKNPPSQLRQIDVHEIFQILHKELGINFESRINNEVSTKDIPGKFRKLFNLSKATLHHPKVQELLHDKREVFDVVIAEWMFNDVYSGIRYVFDCPLIWSSSMEPHHLVLSLIDENHNSVSLPHVWSNHYSSPLSFAERIEELWDHLVCAYCKWTYRSRYLDIYNSAFGSAVAKRGRSLPPYDVAVSNGSLMFGNSHVSIGQAASLPQNYIPINGYHIESDVKPLPEELERIMDAAKHGVIFFSMGTILKIKTMPMKLKMDLLDMFSELNETIVWKVDGTISNVPENVHIINWAPQQSILAHPNCKIFITHGGLLSVTETLHFGVPMIGIPGFADQFSNVNRAVIKGYALRVDISMNTPRELKAAITEILANPRYKLAVSELSSIYHDRVVPPGTELGYWVEHVVRTRGAPHLRSTALMVPWYQEMCLYFFSISVTSIVLLVSVQMYLVKASSQKNNS